MKPSSWTPRRKVIVALGLAGGIALSIGAMTMLNHSAMAQMMHNHGADGTGHDLGVMPGLRGLDATPEESAELAVMFRNFETISREVTNLPNGIHTLTNADDEELLGVVVSHVVGMIDRVDEGRDPKIFIQSPTLDLLFERRAEITTEIDITDNGIVVIQTSTNPDVVAALQTHAVEVTDMANRGMDAVHEAMMVRAGN